MSDAADELYALLPAVYRLRDADLGYPLRGLVTVLAEQADALDADIERLYENWFIETADRWVVPYIGDLLRVGTLATAALEDEDGLSVLPRRFSQRAFVANTIGYRRRKGTVAVLEQVAADVTGWRARAVEFFQLVATTQYAKHPRPASAAFVDVRHGAGLERLDGPFDRAAHTVAVRTVDAPPGSRARALQSQGRHNVPNVGLFLWRLQAYPVTAGTPRPATPPAGAGFTFSPLGVDTPLFNPPATEREISHLATEPDLPVRLSRRVLFDELERRRRAIVGNARQPAGGFFGETDGPFTVRYATAAAPDVLSAVPPDEIAICDLSSWRRPDPQRMYRPARGGPEQPLPIRVGVDPERGRLAFATGIEPARVAVDYAYGFSGNLGGGPYDRRDSAALWYEPAEVTVQIGVTRDPAVLATSTPDARLVGDLPAAVALWRSEIENATSSFGLIVILDSDSYPEALTGAARVDVPAGARLAIVAGAWPEELQPGEGGTPARVLGRLSSDAPVRPHVRADVAIRGTAPAGALNPGELILSGLLIEGRIRVAPGNLGRLSPFDSTAVPANGGLVVEAGSGAARTNGSLRVSLVRSICGPLDLAPPVAALSVADSIIDAGAAPAAIDAAGASLDLQQSTVFGTVVVERLTAGNSLFTAVIGVERRQEGCVRFCHVPEGSSTPNRFRCQPDLALEAQADAAARNRIRASLAPAFASARYGDPDYGQLSLTASHELLTGAEDGSEMGAFSSLKQPQREANLRLALAEYLRSGLDAGIFFVT
ncbi:MAG TPA: hypothetical protein VLA44_04650 [Clostridia bacterium]|nr:hypothetical protein [Clostridia bacterium]